MKYPLYRRRMARIRPKVNNSLCDFCRHRRGRQIDFICSGNSWHLVVRDKWFTTSWQKRRSYLSATAASCSFISLASIWPVPMSFSPVLFMLITEQLCYLDMYRCKRKLRSVSTIYNQPVPSENYFSENDNGRDDLFRDIFRLGLITITVHLQIYIRYSRRYTAR